MLTTRELLSAPGIGVVKVACGGDDPRWSADEPVTSFGVVLVRTGIFERRVDGVALVAEPGVAYLQRPGSIQRVAHPRGGDVCTVVGVSRGMVGTLVDEDRTYPNQPVFTSAEVDLGHRLLAARARQGADQFELSERAAVVAGKLLEEMIGTGVPPRYAAAARSRRMVDQARAALAERPDLRLTDLARMSGVSVYHLSRGFRDVTGITLSRYRIRLRVRAALERMVGGERDLAGVALDVGFADQAHLTRSMRAETGMTPAHLRELLGTQ